jgi:hypothetical protein
MQNWVDRGDELQNEYPEGSPWHDRGVELANGKL